MNAELKLVNNNFVLKSKSAKMTTSFKILTKEILEDQTDLRDIANNQYKLNREKNITFHNDNIIPMELSEEKKAEIKYINKINLPKRLEEYNNSNFKGAFSDYDSYKYDEVTEYDELKTIELSNRYHKRVLNEIINTTIDNITWIFMSVETPTTITLFAIINSMIHYRIIPNSFNNTNIEKDKNHVINIMRNENIDVDKLSEDEKINILNNNITIIYEWNYLELANDMLNLNNNISYKNVIERHNPYAKNKSYISKTIN